MESQWHATLKTRIWSDRREEYDTNFTLVGWLLLQVLLEDVELFLLLRVPLEDVGLLILSQMS